jgi:hypothetical protein
MQNSKIEWTDHTLAVVQLVVALLTKRNAVRDGISQFWIIGPRPDVMGIQVAASIVTAFLASKVIAGEHIETPTLIFGSTAQPYALGCLPILILGQLFTAPCAFAGALADHDPRLDSMSLACPVATALLGSFAHFAARLLAGFLALHRRYERLAAFNPGSAHLCFRFFRVCHNALANHTFNVGIIA